MRDATSSGKHRSVGLGIIAHVLLPLSNASRLQDLKTVFLINCGATEDVRTRCNLSNDNIRVVIVDSHRPIWHGHKDDQEDVGKNTLVFLDDDDPVPAADIPDYREHDMDLKSGESFKKQIMT